MAVRDIIKLYTLQALAAAIEAAPSDITLENVQEEMQDGLAFDCPKCANGPEGINTGQFEQVLSDDSTQLIECDVCNGVGKTAVLKVPVESVIGYADAP